MTLGDPEEIKVIQAAFKMGYEEGRAQEREAIVEWLNASDDKKTQLEHWAIAALVKDGEHLK